MKWQGERESDNVSDVRGSGGGGGGFGGGRSIGIGSVVVALVAGWIFGVNPLTVLGLLDGGSQGSAPAKTQGHAPAADDTSARFVAAILASTEDVWTESFKTAGMSYRAPRLNIFRGSYPTACGRGEAAMGPFYCPGDEQVYIDLSFYETMRKRLGAPGDFAQAYVVAHEVGHHVQHLLGISDKVDAMRGRASQAQQNALSVRLELQADCFAGIWAQHSQQAKGWLEQGDIEEGLNAASQIGDDALQRQSTGTVRPESFTHGTSAQRVAWFKRGLASGKMVDCNTFDNRQL